MPLQPAPPTMPAAAPAPRPAARRGVSSSMSPLNPRKFGFDEARHLLLRAGFGGTPRQVQALQSWGLEKSVDYLINFDKVSDDPTGPDLFDRDIKHPPTPEERAEQRRAQAANDKDKITEMRLMREQSERDDREQMKRLQHWWLKKMVETSRPLQEKLTLFWHGHFATSYRTIEDSYHMFAQNELFRRHAAGDFAQLLHRIVEDPAMIAYLDNNDSRKNKPNENLARELMELFSLGVGNYTEGDIKEGAKALTGFTFRDDSFQFEKNNHDDGPKTILGASGRLDGHAFVDVILRQRACAQFMAAKFYRFFVGDYPTGDRQLDAAANTFVNEMATVFRSNYHVGKLLKKVLMSEHFFDPAVRNEQIKSPVMLAVGTVRSLNTPVRELSVLADACDKMGQNVFFPPSVKGWDGGRSWINTSTLFVRQNLTVFLLTGRRANGRDGMADKEPFPGSELLAHLADAYPDDFKDGSAAGKLNAILKFTVGTPNPAARAVLDEFVADRAPDGAFDAAVMRDLMMLVTSLPEYQLC
ncbi:MAG TPA: DUF1800 domain-containing protein [Phycisphaerales bacterium]|nr:DUF1800 domain-containing protein [Phycisphaerales bacterium]